MPETNTVDRCRCPVCGAVQDWSAECRRCAADLTLLREVADAAKMARQDCLLAVSQGRRREALAHARRLIRLRPDDAGKQLLAVCLLMCEEFDEAISLAK